MNELEQFALMLRCSYCGAIPGENCQTRNGFPASRLHFHGRTRWIWEAYSFGRDTMREDMLQTPGWYARLRERWLAQHPDEEAGR